MNAPAHLPYVVPDTGALGPQGLQRALLASALSNPEDMALLAEQYPVEAVVETLDHDRLVWRAMLAVHARGQLVEPLLVGQELQATAGLRLATAAVLLARLVEAYPVASNVPAYLEICLDAWRKRRAAEELEMALARLKTGAAEPDWHEKLGARLAATAAPPVSKLSRADRLLPVLYAEDLDAPMQAFPWLIKELGMMRGRPLILSGYGDAGKTFAAQELMLAVARGDRLVWGSLVVELAGPVVHIDLEQQLEMTRWRYRRLAFGKGYKLSSLGRQLELSSLPPMLLTDPEAEEALVERCTGKALCLIDNLTAGTPGVDENSKAMAAPLYMMNRVSARTNCTILLIHHEGKSGEMPKSAAQRIRGHSSIHGALGGGVSFTKQPDGAIKIEQAKSSMGEGEPAFFRFEDRGQVEAATGKSEGIELVWMPREQMAQEGTAKTDHEKELAFEHLKTSVLGCVKRNPGIGGVEPIAKRLERRPVDVRAAFDELVDQKRIENRGGKAPKCRWFATGSEGSNDE